MLANLDQVILLAPGYFAARRRGRPRLSLDAIAHGRPFLEHARVSSLPSARCTPSLRPTCEHTNQFARSKSVSVAAAMCLRAAADSAPTRRLQLLQGHGPNKQGVLWARLPRRAPVRQHGVRQHAHRVGRLRIYCRIRFTTFSLWRLSNAPKAGFITSCSSFRRWCFSSVVSML